MGFLFRMNAKIKMQFPELNYNFDFSTIEIDENYSMAFTDGGRGEKTLLFVHGLSSNIPAWSKLIPLLKKNFRCIAIDLPGYGKSSSTPHSGGMKFYAQSIYNFISKMNLRNVYFVGHSMGGQVTITTVLEYPQAIEGLILLAPAGFETFSIDESEKLKKYFSPQSYENLSDEQIRFNYEINFFDMPSDAKKMIEDRIEMKSFHNFKNYCRVVSNSLAGMLDYPVIKNLNKIKIRTLVVFGKDDKLIPNKALHASSTPETIAQVGPDKIKDCELKLISNCGHFIQFEKPEETALAIKAFIGI